MKLIKIYISIFVSIAILLSCTRDESSSSINGMGKLSLNYIGVNTEIINTAPTRSSFNKENNKSLEDYVKDGFSIAVYTHTNPTLVYQCDNYEEYQSGKCEDVELRSGYYDLITVLGNPKQEGFDIAPCYSDTVPSNGQEPVHIKNGEETSVNFDCKLYHSVLNIKYTDNFKKYFSSYSASVSTSGGNNIIYAQEEMRYSYFQPGEVTVYVTAKKDGAKESTFNVGTYKLSSRHMYDLIIDVDASSSIMTISFSDAVSGTEPITIDVSDAALNAAAPKIIGSEGFVSGEKVEIIEGEIVDKPYAVSINAEGLIKHCVLTTNSKYLTDNGWPSTIDLMSSSEEDINKLKALGLELRGLEVDAQMAYLDFTKVVSNLPTGNDIEISIAVTDKYGKSSDNPFVLMASTRNCNFSVSRTDYELPFLGNECKINVSFLAGDPRNVKYFFGDTEQEFSVIDVEEMPASGDMKNYTVTLKGDDDIKFINSFHVKTKYFSYNKDTEKYNVGYGVLIDNDGDIWARKVVLHVYNMEDLDGLVIQKMDNNNSWNNVEPSFVETSKTDIIVKGLASNTSYKFRALKTGKEPTNIVEAITEKELQIPNAGFEEWHNKHIWTGISLTGGDVPMYSFYPYLEGDDNSWWSTKNDYTTAKAGDFSYYYIVYPGTTQLPSDWNAASKIGYPNTPCSGNYSAEIATVGHGEGSTCTTGLLGNNMNCKKHTPGSLFVGTYENGKENLGKEFDVRPSKMRFIYRLHVLNGESASAMIRLENRTNNDVVKLGEGIIYLSESKKDNTEAEVKLTYENTLLKATHIIIYFTSSISDNPSITPYYDKDNFRGNRYSRGIGNVLTIDDIKLIYE